MYACNQRKIAADGTALSACNPNWSNYWCDYSRVRQDFTANWNASHDAFALVSAIFAIGRCVDGLGLSEVWKREQSGNGLDFRCCNRKSRPHSIAADSTVDRQHLADASLRRQCRTRGGCRAAGCNGCSLDRKPHPIIAEAKKFDSHSHDFRNGCRIQRLISRSACRCLFCTGSSGRWQVGISGIVASSPFRHHS